MSSTAEVSSRDQDNVRDKDPGWKYSHNPDPKDKNRVKCNFCRHISTRGISRQKRHLARVKGDVAACKKVPEEVKNEISQTLTASKTKKRVKEGQMQELRSEVDLTGDRDDEDDVEVDESCQISSRGSLTQKAPFGSKKPRTKGPMDVFYAPDHDANVGKGKSRQTNIKDTFGKQERARVCQYIARWMYQAGIAFNTVRLKSFHTMIEAIGQYGPKLVGPTPYELSVKFLKHEVKHTYDNLKPHREAWTKFGCSIMTDAWTYRKSRSIMNLCVNCPLGTSFLRSVDASNDKHDATYIFKLVDGCINEVGEDNVIQVVTDNAAANLAAARMLKVVRPKIFWTSCAAHCIDLMLEDIGKLKKVKGVIDNARELTVFIYSHHSTLSMMRSFTNKRDIVRPGVTRFATAFLSLKSIHDKKDDLRKMFTSDEWHKNAWSKHTKGKKIVDIIFSNAFWRNVLYALKVFGPLVKVLRMVDSDVIPAMGFIYTAMENVQNEIKEALNQNENLYKPITEIIEAKWDKQLHCPLHAAGYFLNPIYQYGIPDIHKKEGIMSGFLDCVEGFYRHDQGRQDKIALELRSFQNALGSFGRDMAIRQRSKVDHNPVDWWTLHGGDAPLLQDMAIKILSLTCSSFGCERNWSCFEMVHTKKRNRLDQKKMNDLVYVQFNARLKDRHERKARDPLVERDLNATAEWLVVDLGEEEVFVGDGLTWNMVEEAQGSASAPRRTTRSTSTLQRLRDEIEPSSDDEIEEDDKVYDSDDKDDDVGDEVDLPEYSGESGEEVD